MNIYNNFSMNNILSIIDSPIFIALHNHPLIYCFTFQRANWGTSWKCNCCSNVYTYNIPTFYCTFCDFDVCENCIANCCCGQIFIYNFENSMNYGLLHNAFNMFNWQFIFPSHNHLLTLIQKRNKSKNFNWICKMCSKIYDNNQPFFYCSLCDYY